MINSQLVLTIFYTVFLKNCYYVVCVLMRYHRVSQASLGPSRCQPSIINNTISQQVTEIIQQLDDSELTPSLMSLTPSSRMNTQFLQCPNDAN